MKEKKLLPDHWVSKEFGLEVFTHPEEIFNFVYVITSNGVIHRFHGTMLDDIDRARPRIEELNGRTYTELAGQLSILLNRIKGLTDEYYVSNGSIEIQTIQDLQELRGELLDRYKS